MRHFSQQNAIIFATIERGETVPGEEWENRREKGRDINADKGRSLTVKVSQEAVTEALKGKVGNREEKKWVPGKVSTSSHRG